MQNQVLHQSANMPRPCSRLGIGAQQKSYPMSVLAPMHRALLSTLVGAVRLSVRYANSVLIAATVVSALLLWYTAGHVAINTDTTDMLDANLPFRKAKRGLPKN